MISNNSMKTSNNYFANYGQTSHELAHSNQSNNTSNNTSEIDTNVHNLSNRKLWQILQLNQIKGCELDEQFISDVKHELMARNDFNECSVWHKPH